MTRTQQTSHVDPNHSVTCALCGELADERRTVNLTTDLGELGPGLLIEAPVRVGCIFKLVNDYGHGEAHEGCFDDAMAQYRNEIGEEQNV